MLLLLSIPILLKILEYWVRRYCRCSYPRRCFCISICRIQSDKTEYIISWYIQFIGIYKWRTNKNISSAIFGILSISVCSVVIISQSCFVDGDNYICRLADDWGGCSASSVDIRGCLHESGLSFNPDRTHFVPVKIIGDWIIFVYINPEWFATHSGSSSSDWLLPSILSIQQRIATIILVHHRINSMILLSVSLKALK